MKEKYDICQGKNIKIGLRQPKTPNQRMAEKGKNNPAVNEQRNQSNSVLPTKAQDVDEKRYGANKKKGICRNGDCCFYIINGLGNCNFWHKAGTKFTPNYNESRSVETYNKNLTHMTPPSSIHPWTFGTFSQLIPTWSRFGTSQSFNTNQPKVPMPKSIPDRSQEALTQSIPTWNQPNNSQSTNIFLYPTDLDHMNESNEIMT